MADNKAMIHERLEALRGEMRKVSADYFLITSSDYHASEYVGDFFKVTEYFSGCTSDNVVMIVDASSAKLWTDGRYFISAAGELEGTEVELMKMGEPGVPTVPAYLQSVIRKGQVLAFDGRCVTSGAGKLYRAIAEKAGATVNGTFCPQDTIWNDRPALSSHPVFLITAEDAGESYEEKAARVRKKTEEAGAATLILSKLDDICWLLNMRGGDVDYNPVALSYFILGQTSAHLFIQESELTDEFRAYAESNKIELHPYDAIFAFVKENTFDGAVLADPTGTSDTMLHLLQEKGVKVIEAENPTAIMKALKNETELTRSREAYLLDSVAVCRFIYWVKKNIGTIPMTEVSAAEYLDHLRSEIPGYIDLSFGTISAYNANAAMAHYAPTAEKCSTLKPEGFLLVDSGGQYRKGTTDVTRTIVLGTLTPEMIEHFTVVAISNLRLLYAKFLEGVNGVGLDTYARAPFWERGLNFNHGTGHGIGYILNVHEGPQNIRWKARSAADLTEFKPGMITSDEPGMYVEGRYGIRTETIVECVDDETNEWGHFLRFVPLTFAPIDLEAIDPSIMDASDIQKLNDYHRLVWEKVSPFLQGEEKEWLRESTRAI